MAQEPKNSRFIDASAAVTGGFWRKMVLSTALSGSLFMGSVPLQAEAADAPPPNPQTQGLGTGPEPELQLPEELMKDIRAQREEMRRIAISEALVIEAQKNFNAVAPTVQNNYSRGLMSLQSRLTNSLLNQGGNPNVHDRVVFLDPVQFDTARALGMEPQNAVRALLALAKASADDAQVDTLAEHMSTGRYDLRYDLSTTTQDPAALYNAEKMNAQACVVVPSSDYMPIVIPGITAAERVDFTNRHEGWHCLDTRYLLQGLSIKEVDASKVTTEMVLSNPDMLKYMSLTTRKESLADLGAVGDMIRQEGKGLAFLDAIRDWRASQTRDVGHMSVLALQGMRDAITGMGGVEAFRAMDEKKMEDFYFAINERYGIQPKTYEYALRLDSSSEAMRGSLTRAFGGTQEFDKAVAFRALYTHTTPPVKYTDALTPEEKATLRAVTAYDPRKKLEDEAFKTSGKITPATMIAAYGRLQGRFQEELARNPADITTPALMGKLQNVFVQDLTHIDYLVTNARRGVNIVSIEPALAAFRTPYQPTEPQSTQTKPAQPQTSRHHHRNSPSSPKP